MTSSTTSGVYLQVIEDVINKVRDELANNDGPDESVLDMLQKTWVSRMIDAGAILGGIERSSAEKQNPRGYITPVHDLNVPYEVTEYETPTADMLFPPTPFRTPLPGTAQTPLPGIGDNSVYNIPTDVTPVTPSDFSCVKDFGGVSEMKDRRPSLHMQPPSAWMNQRTLSVDVNVAYVEGREDLDRGTPHQPMMQDFFISSGKRKREEFGSRHINGRCTPQRDGAENAMSDHFQVSEGSYPERNRVVMTQGSRFSSRIPQSDGPIPDPYDDAANIYSYQGEDYNIVNTPALNDPVSTPLAVVLRNAVGDDDDESLNEDDDEEEEDLDSLDLGGELNTHLVLAQFDKVTRTKSRWRCTLKDGIMHKNNIDILFNKANGEFDF